MTTTNRVLVYMSKAHVQSNQSQTKAANKTPVRPYTDVAAARSPCAGVAAARPHTGTAPAHGHAPARPPRPRGHKEPKYPVHPSSVKYNTSNTHHGREETHVRKVQHHV